MNTFLLYGSMFFFLIFVVLSFVDGVYLHLIKLKIQENFDSKREHLTHTLRAILFIPITFMIFYWNLSGAWLWLAIGMVLTDLIIEGIDVLEERRSREKIGGLSSGEYFLHVMLITSRVAAISLALASKPIEAWSTNVYFSPYPETMKFIISQLIPGAVIIAILHIVLIYKPFLISKLVARLQKNKVYLGPYQ